MIGKRIYSVMALTLLIVLAAGGLFAQQSQVNLQQITTERCWDSFPVWYQDGKHLLVTSDRLGGMGLWKISTEGGAAIQVTAANPGTNDLWPDIHPKTGEIIFSTNRAGKSYQIFLILPGKVGLTQLTSVPYDATHPKWSPKGDRIAFCCPDRNGDSFIWIMGRDGSNLCQIAQGYQPVWSPDGARLALSKESVIGDKKNWDIYTIGVDGTALAQVTSEESDELQPDWSPDGKWMSYVSIREKYPSPKSVKDILKGLKSKRNFEIWIKNTSESVSSAIQITSWSGVDVYPRWSPSGKQIAFASDRAGSLDIWCTQGVLPNTAGR